MGDAIARWSEALARDPASPAFVPLADELRRRGQLDAALSIVRRGLARHPDLADAHDVHARLLVDRGDLEAAHAAWERVAALVPGHPGALKGMGFVRFRQGRLAEAERFLAAAAAADPADERNRSALAYVRAQLAATAAYGATAAPPPPGAFAVPADGAAVVPAALPRSPRELFAGLGDDGAAVALLVDADGLVAAGEAVTHEGRDVAAELGAAMSGVGEEAARAMRHLGMGEWRAVVFETDRATVALAPAPSRALVLLAAARATPLGFVRKLLDQARERAARFLARTEAP
jgi:predicted regulator of Ras-like GTPase activity (Roadblock/LC7/MglB family)